MAALREIARKAAQARAAGLDPTGLSREQIRALLRHSPPAAGGAD